jgi:hypothetical protein
MNIIGINSDGLIDVARGWKHHIVHLDTMHLDIVHLDTMHLDQPIR